MINLLTSYNLDWFETEIKGKQVYILSFDIDYDLYLFKQDDEYVVYKCNKKSNELTLKFKNDDLDMTLQEVKLYCRSSGIMSFWLPEMDWKGYTLSYKQQKLAKNWNIKFNNTWEFHMYMSKFIANKVLKGLL